MVILVLTCSGFLVRIRYGIQSAKKMVTLVMTFWFPENHLHADTTRKAHSFFFYFLFYIGIELINNVVSGEQQRHPAIPVSILP